MIVIKDYAYSVRIYPGETFKFHDSDNAYVAVKDGEVYPSENGSYVPCSGCAFGGTDGPGEERCMFAPKCEGLIFIELKINLPKRITFDCLLSDRELVSMFLTDVELSKDVLVEMRARGLAQEHNPGWSLTEHGWSTYRVK